MDAPTSPEFYRSHVNEAFLVHHAGGVSEIALTEVKVQIDDEVQLCFSLFFSRTDAVLPQETYRMSHPVLGEFDMFLVPVQKVFNSPVIYQGGFNLLKSESPDPQPFKNDPGSLANRMRQGNGSESPPPTVPLFRSENLNSKPITPTHIHHG